MQKIYTLLLWACLLGFSSAQAQIVIKGVVRDGETSETLPGCSVTLKGTTQGTVTAADGSFQLSVPNPQARLIFDFIGYTRQEREVQIKSPWEIVLMPSANELKELIVVGYGSTASKDVTGAAKSKVPISIEGSSTLRSNSYKGKQRGFTSPPLVGSPERH